MMTRREFVTKSAIAAAAARSCIAQAQRTEVVRTVAQGQLRGVLAGDVQIFRGVPFAEPPLGGLRFRAPRPLRPWTTVRDAQEFSAAAIQPGAATFRQSEDCLYLNIWAPQGKGPFPVFVWIHGGGFTAGRASEPIYDGTRFAQAGVVCITVQYRLGVFGFLDVSKLFGPKYTGSADNALLDLMAALGWVQTNIAAFGGDPKQVTIGGESAGAKLAGILMGVPAAEPFFHQVISESGGAERIWTEANSAAITQGFADAWTQKTGRSAQDLLTSDAKQLLNVQEEFTKTWPQHFPLRAELNEMLMPKPPLASIREGSARGKRLLLGTNRDESALFLGPHPQRAVSAADLGNLTMDQFQPLQERYRALYPQDPDDRRRIRAVTAEEYWIPSLRVAEAHVSAGGEAYVYRLDFPGSGRFAGLAFHSYDLRFVWDYFGEAQPSAPERSLATAVHAAWVSFIQGKQPTGPSLPAWPLYSIDKRPTMILDQASHVELAPNAAEYRLWDGLLVN